MNAILWLLRVFAYIYHLCLSVFLLAIGTFAGMSGAHEVNLGMLPWAGSTLVRALIVLGLAGLLCTIPAMTGALRWLFPLWTLVVLGLMVRGFYLSSYSFADNVEFQFSLWLTAGAFIAFLASLSLLTKKSKR